ncbi:MAG: DUF4493 domain-containing protein, partial [Muribaculaceae bacterium]|nr:DUF4493 domain-containing protein [Muribaculaceae bacterium]
MKQSLILGLVGTAALLAGCNDDRLPGAWTSSTGGIAPTVSVDASVSTASRALHQADAIEASDLSLRLVSADGTVDRTWDKVADFDPKEEFAVGDYTMYAYYGDGKSEGFDQPYYQGSTSLSVRENRTTPVEIKAGLANTMVSVAYTDAFKSYMADWSAELNSSDGAATVVYAKDETRPAYLAAGTVTLKVNFTKPNGISATALAATINARARHHYNVTVDVNDGGVGDAVLTVTYDDGTEEVEVEIDLSDKIISAAAPEITSVGFVSGDVINHVEHSAAEQQLKANIVARGGLASVVLATESASLRGQGWPAEIDLMTADAATQATLTSLGLEVKGLFKNPDKMAVVDFSNVLSHLAITASDVKESTFTLTVTDRYTKQSEPVGFTVSLIKLELSLTGHGAMIYGADNVDLQVAYNGTNAEKDLTFQAKNARGSWDKLAVNSITETAEGRYTANVAIPAADKNMTFRAVCATGLVSEEMEVPVGGIKLVAPDANVFATYAMVEVSGDIADDMTFEYSADGGNSYANAGTAPRAAKSRVATAAYKVSGLPAGSTVLLRAKTSEHTSNPIEIQTEAAAQLPNGNVDAETTIDGNGRHWENYVFAGGWGTNNAMTTSQGSDYGYCRISGTKPTDDAHAGKAVAIRTNGWGSGNTAWTGVSGRCKYIDAGLYHLGATRTTRPSGYSDISGSFDTDDLECGIAFASRPSALSFYYKYNAKNDADHGEALIRVVDENGNTIC